MYYSYPKMFKKSAQSQPGLETLKPGENISGRDICVCLVKLINNNVCTVMYMLQEKGANRHN